MHIAYKLNKQGDNIVLTWFVSNFEPFCYSMSGSNHCFLTRIQVSQEASEMVWSSHLFKNFPQLVVTYTVKKFSIVSEARDLFLGFFCLFYDPMDVGNLISGSSAFSKSSLYMWKLSVHILLESSLKDFEHCLASMQNQCNCAVVWEFFGIGFLWDWNENWPFPILWSRLSFTNLLTYWGQHFNDIIF